VTARVSPADRIRAEIDGLFADPDLDLAQVVEDVARLGARLILQTALEAEVTEFLGRPRYGRGDRAREGSRNGHREVTVKTTAGPVQLERPKLRGADEKFASRLLGKHVARSNALESLAISGWVRGLSDRDIEAALAEALGPDAALSKSTVSRVCQALKEQYAAWTARRLDDVELEYLYVDASHFRYHVTARAEPVLCAYGITTTGQPVFLGLDAASAESTDACLAFLSDLTRRGLRPPLLSVSDGGPGLTAAIDQAFPDSLRQRCLIHRLGNLLAKVSTADHDQVRVGYWRIFDDLDAPPGQLAVDQATRRAEAFADCWRARYPRMVQLLLGELGYLTAHLRFPREHWRRIRHTNLIERTFGESRRRVKVLGRLPGEHTCLALVWAVLDRASRGWRGLDMNPANVRHLQQLRADLHHPTTASAEHMIDLPEPVTPAA
jgi:transposase-like protein